MKKETGKQSKKWLWLVLGLVLLLAVVGVVLALVFGGSGGEEVQTGGRPELYWNVARADWVDPETGTSIRQASADGMYYVTFAYNGEQVEYPVSDKKLVNYIDTMDVMNLVFDSDGIVVDVQAPEAVATVISNSLYVQRTDENTVVANSTITLNGMIYNLKVTELTEIYEVSGNGEFEGVKIDPTSVGAMATIAVYANSEKEVTHIYVKNYPVESKIYWRADQFYSSTTKATTRVPDEDGAYSINFFCEGELVTLKCKDEAIVTNIDSTSWNYPHFGFRFDEDGYIVEILNSGIASRTVLACQCFDITQYDGQYFTATRLTKNDGQYYEGMITEDTVIYDVSTAAKSEGTAGTRVDALQMGDRVCVWTDADGNVVLIYISVRLVDSPVYYRPSRKYDSTTGETKREPNAQGVYEIELLKEGDTEKTVYKTTDKAIATAVDEPKYNCLGLKVDENNNIIYVYDIYSLFGSSYFCLARYVTEVTGSIANFMSSSDPTAVKGGVLTEDCKVYNVSSAGNYGEETTLQVGDYVYAYKKVTGEIIHVYVVRRYLGEDTMYFNIGRQYDSEAKQTTRVPDADGWYWFDMVTQGKQVRLKTKDPKIVHSIDSQSLSIFSLEVNGDVITDVYGAQYGTGGSKIASGYGITSINSDGTVDATHVSNGKTTSFKMAEDCVIYNVSSMFDKYQGEIGTLKVGDMITAYTNMYGEAKVIFVRRRDCQNMYWKVDRYYDSTNAVTTREPDADGWYWFDLAVNGKRVTLKTQDKAIATSMDSQEGGFGLNVQGNVIKSYLSSSRVKNVSGTGYNAYTVTSINGSKVTLTYTLPSSKSTGKTVEIVLDKNVKVYDVSDPLASDFGKAATLQVGDVVRTYLSEDKETQTYVYIRAHCTRKGGYMSYCDHCDQVVYWNPYMGSIASYDGHYYLFNDRVNTTYQNLGSKSRDFETVLDLNGHTLERSNGRTLRVYRNETLSIIDSVGGGKIIGNMDQAVGGVLMISEGGTVNLYGGTLELTDNEDIKPGRGGVVYLSGSTCTFNMYGGTITGGRSYARKDEFAAGGNLYVTSGTFNMTGGTITGGKAYNGTYEKDNGDGTTTTKALSSYGGNVYLGGSAVANITGGTIEGGYCENGGGNIAILNSKVKLTVKGATISGGEAKKYGGNFYAQGTVTLTGATVTGGTAARGGSVYATGGTLLLNGGTKVTGGTAGDENTSGYGGNFYIRPATVTIADATVADGTSVTVGGNFYCIYEGVLNITDGAVISGGQSRSNGGNFYVAANQEDETTGLATRKFTLNISGGTITEGESLNQSGGNIYQYGGYLNISGGKITDGLCKADKYGGNIYVAADEFNLSGGVISGGKAGEKSYDIFSTNKTLYMSISGGTVEGRFRVNCPYTIDISGAPKLDNLDLFRDVMLTVGELHKDASITLKTGTSGLIFTEAFDKAEEYAAAGYFVNIEDGSAALANADNRLYLVAPVVPEPDYNLVYEAAVAMTQQGVFDQGGTVSAQCPYCDKEVQWTALEANTASSGQPLAGGHYYLAGDIENTIHYSVDDDVCLHLNGHNITSPQRNFYVDSKAVMTVMGDGVVTGGFEHATNTHYGANLDNVGILNLCGGTYMTTSTNPAIGSRGRTTDTTALNIYNGTLIQGNGTNAPLVVIFGKTTMNMHGGTITGGTNTGNGGNIYMKPDEYTSRTLTLNIYGGTITGGTAALGGNIYAQGGVGPVYMNIIGGEITGGSVYANNLMTGVGIAGNAVIENLDLSDGTVIELAELTEGAAIAVTGTGVFTGTLDNPSDYLTYISAYENGKFIEVTESGALSVGGEAIEPEDICPHCGVAFADITWTEVEGGTTSYAVPASGHYRLTGDIVTSTGTSFTVPKDTNYSVVLDMNGHTIETTSSSATTNRAVYVNPGASLVIVDLNDEDATVGQIKSATTAAGATVYVDSNATLDVYDITIHGTTGNSTKAGGAVRVYKRGTMNLHSGTITAGNTTGTGTSISLATGSVAATLNIYGGTVTGSIHDQSGESAIYIEGAPVIADLDLSNGTTVTLGELTAGASIAVTAQDSVPFTDVLENASFYANYFKANGNHMSVLVNADNKLIVTAVCPHCEVPFADITWTELDFGTTDTRQSITKDTVAESGEHYRLVSDYIYTASKNNALTVGDADNSVDIILDMNGYNIEATASSNRAIYVYGEFVLVDLNGDADDTTVGQVKSVGTSAGATVYVDSNATLDVYDITINGTTGSSTKAGGAICVNAGGTLNLYSGTITAGNTTGVGTAVGVGSSSKGATFNIYGGTITGSVYDRPGKGTICIEGAPVIAELDLTNGVTVTLGELTDGASIGVNAADDTAFTAAMENAADYLTYIQATVTGKTVSVNADNCLVITNDQAAATE